MIDNHFLPAKGVVDPLEESSAMLVPLAAVNPPGFSMSASTDNTPSKMFLSNSMLLGPSNDTSWLSKQNHEVVIILRHSTVNDWSHQIL